MSDIRVIGAIILAVIGAFLWLICKAFGLSLMVLYVPMGILIVVFLLVVLVLSTWSA